MKTVFILFLTLVVSVGMMNAEVYSGTCGANLKWTMDSETSVLTISGNGTMSDYNVATSGRAPWNKYSPKKVIIQEGVTSIGTYTFYYHSISEVSLPQSLTSIGNSAFSDCKSLLSIDIPNNVTSIGGGVFYNCSGLTSVTIPNSVTSIGSSAFYGCSGLTSITIPNSVTTIGRHAFKNCSSLTSITIPNSVTSIGDQAFYSCKIQEILFKGTMEEWLGKSWYPSTVSSSYSLYINDVLVTDAVIPNSVTSIGDDAFRSCSSLTSVTIPNSVTNIGNSAFYSCTNLTSVAIPNSVTNIGDNAFYGCSSLTSVAIPNSVTSIGEMAFYGCTYLENIVIGSGVNVEDGIGQKAFYGCRYLLSVTCKAVYPPAINANVFEGCGVLSGVDLYVPEKSVARYKKASVWSEFNIVGKDLSVDDPTNPTNPEDGKYTITWQDEDGNVIKTDQVAQGTTPAFTGTTPTKPATNEYTYEFAGWLPTIKAATEDVRYTTFFERNKIEPTVYTVNINGENCSLNINNQYPEGTVITIEAVADECFEFQQWSDGNKDNPRTVTVTKDMNLTAEFNKLRYTVTGQTETGTGGKVQIIKK